MSGRTAMALAAAGHAVVVLAAGAALGLAAV